jgi:23S rRNA maturation mini-RNase III
MLSASGSMNKSLDNKEETTYRRAKERKAQKKHKEVTGYLKNMPN